ncbi:MAG: hypothetical protein BMS9Abin26_1214 [Gammaproteobacteria bacterium]|nr:MAG: hypothetical protein BMS9Abin26_1214 [Gammaproteobacteria bacterium]
MSQSIDANRHYADPGMGSPFSLLDESAYLAWREQKLSDYPLNPADLLVNVGDPRDLDVAEHQAILKLLNKTNMAIYQSADRSEDKQIPRYLGLQFGLRRLDPNMLADDDGITSLQVVSGKSLRGYIPYSNKRLLWHTDGYYNVPEHRIRALLLHCVRSAEHGGENSLLDPEIAYIHLRDENPDYIHALMDENVMTIPANEEIRGSGGSRPAQAGPVFSVDEATGRLHMRYTARTRSIVWATDSLTKAAVNSLKTLLASDSKYIFTHKLTPGQGLISNNVLHNRRAFECIDETNRDRLLYRARYYDAYDAADRHAEGA